MPHTVHQSTSWEKDHNVPQRPHRPSKPSKQEQPAPPFESESKEKPAHPQENDMTPEEIAAATGGNLVVNHPKGLGQPQGSAGVTVLLYLKKKI